MAPGVNVRPGDRLKAINGRRLTREIVPQELLVHQADTEVTLTIEGEDGKTREVTVKALKSEMPARYREWVEANRRRVHEASGGRAGDLSLDAGDSRLAFGTGTSRLTLSIYF